MLGFVLSNITFCFLMSTFFNRASIAASASAVIYVFLFYVNAFLDRLSKEGLLLDEGWPVMFVRHFLSFFLVVLAQPTPFQSLVSNVAVVRAFKVMGILEKKNLGLQWNNIQWVDDFGFSVLEYMFMLLVDALLYLMAALYIEAVFPGECNITIVEFLGILYTMEALY